MSIRTTLSRVDLRTRFHDRADSSHGRAMSGDDAERYYSRRMRLLEERQAIQQEWDFLARYIEPDAILESVGPGWHALVLGLHDELLRLDPDYQLHAFGEERGGLYFGARFSPDAERDCTRVVQAIRARALITCELCAAPGVLRAARPQAKTLCDDCWISDRTCAASHGERYAAARMTQLLSCDEDYPSAEEVVAWLDELDAS